MDRRWTFFCLLINFVHISNQLSFPDSPTYRAAVLEYPSNYVVNDSQATLERNTNEYIGFIEKASQENVDIIVFPEDGLISINLPPREGMEPITTLIPAASDNYNPCTQDTIAVSSTLRNISCAAKNNNIYVVINIAEKVPCSGAECPSDNHFYYNSNVAFDRTGKIIAKYRKTNLFFEPQFNVTSVPEVVTFETDFGVKFGMMICFDILFYEPALNLTRAENVTDIVFPLAWFSETPFLTAVQVQLGWSYGEDVNLLASGYNRPLMGNSGSGIFLGRNGVGKAVMAKTTHKELLISDVPKKNRNSVRPPVPLPPHNDLSEQKCDHCTKEQEENAPYELFLIADNLTAWHMEPFSSSIKKVVCDEAFCCHFDIKMSNPDPKFTYKMSVFRGTRTFAFIVPAKISACAVVRCTNDANSTCGILGETTTIFDKIKITGNFENYKDLLIMPSMIDSDLYPLKHFVYRKHSHNNRDAHVEMSLTKPARNVVTFGIYARDFTGGPTVNTVLMNNYSAIGKWTTRVLSTFT